MLRKVRGLLAQAEDQSCTPAEAEAFSRKAEELIARHAIDAALLQADGTEHKGKPTIRKYETQNPYGKAKGGLLTGIAQAYNCRVIMHGRDKSFTVVGFESDLAAVDMLYTSLLIQGNHAVLSATDSGKSFRAAFWYGFARRVSIRMKEQRRTAEAETTGAALVLRDRSAEVDSHVSDLFPNLRAGTRANVRNAAGWSAGDAAGRNANIGTKTFSGGHAAIA